MNLREDIKQLKTGTSELRKFGLLVGGVFILLGSLALWNYKAYYPNLLIPGATLAAVGAILPRILRWPYVVWMSVAFVLGFIMAHVILTLFFYAIVTPIGVLARLTGKDFLSLKLQPTATTYWIPREAKATQPEEYERQF